MTAAREKEPATKVPTWLEFLPELAEAPTITREELLAAFSDVPLTERTLRHWEAVGALPRPIRRWRDGATRTLYPQWFGELVAMVGDRRERGDSLSAIAADMPIFLRGIAYLHWAAEHSVAFLPGELRPAVDDLARRIEEGQGVRVAHAELRFVDEAGQAVSRLVYNRPSDGTDSRSPITGPTDG